MMVAYALHYSWLRKACNLIYIVYSNDPMRFIVVNCDVSAVFIRDKNRKWKNNRQIVVCVNDGVEDDIDGRLNAEPPRYYCLLVLPSQ